jgi:hypothetical protein
MVRLILVMIFGMVIGFLPTFAQEIVNLDVKGVGAKNITAFDRVGERKVGGYFDTEYFMMRDGTRTFKAHRFILQASSQVHERVFVNSEIEFEYGAKIEAGGPSSDEGEVKIEQAWVDFSLNDNHYLRAGIVLVPFGIVNILHDSDVRDTTQRPLYAKYVVPSTWMDTGVGAHGTFDVGEMEFNYEGYMVNGLSNKDGTFDKGIRNLRPNFKADNNDSAAMTARLGFSPIQGLELGTSTYLGKYDDAGNGLTMIGLDLFWKKGPFELVSEWAKVDIDATTGNPSGINGYYVETRYHFFPSFLKNSLFASGFSHPTFTLFARYGAVDLNEDDVNTGDQSRISLGVNYRPTETVVFKIEAQRGATDGDAKKAESGFISSVAIGF